MNFRYNYIKFYWMQLWTSARATTVTINVLHCCVSSYQTLQFTLLLCSVGSWWSVTVFTSRNDAPPPPQPQPRTSLSAVTNTSLQFRFVSSSSIFLVLVKYFLKLSWTCIDPCVGLCLIFFLKILKTSILQLNYKHVSFSSFSYHIQSFHSPTHHLH